MSKVGVAPKRRRIPQNSRGTEHARKAAAARWTPEKRNDAAIKTLVDNAPALTDSQTADLAALLERRGAVTR